MSTRNSETHEKLMQIAKKSNSEMCRLLWLNFFCEPPTKLPLSSKAIHFWFFEVAGLEEFRRMAGLR